jgi:hypothetical protein
MKRCSKCEVEKKDAEFHEIKTENRLRGSCKSCVYHFQKERWKDRKRQAIELMGGECCNCGYKKNMAALHFHHLDPTEKDCSWTKMRLKSWDKAVVELKKCVLICANCHAEEHSPDLNLIFDDTGKSNSNWNKGPKSTGNCPVCKSDLFGTIYCSQACSSLSRRKAKRPTKDELKKLMKENSWCALGRKYNVSDNAVRKWAKSYGLI